MNKWIDVTQLVDGNRGFPYKMTGFVFTVTRPDNTGDTYRVTRHDLKRRKIWAKKVSGIE